MNIDGFGQAHIRVDTVKWIHRRPCSQLASLLTERFNNFDIAGIAEGSPSNQGSFEGLNQFGALDHVSNALSVRRSGSDYMQNPWNSIEGKKKGHPIFLWMPLTVFAELYRRD